jgi:hypothetical protein
MGMEGGGREQGGFKFKFNSQHNGSFYSDAILGWDANAICPSHSLEFINFRQFNSKSLRMLDGMQKNGISLSSYTPDV